jgi:hypothetical protein
MSWVCPVLVGIEPSEVKGPLAQFQATRATKEDIRALLGTINKRLEAPLADVQIDKLHNLLWPDLEAKIADLIKEIPKASSPHRSSADLLTEVLERVRSLERKLSDSQPLVRDLSQYILARPALHARNVRRNEVPPPDSETLLAKFTSRALGSQKTISAIEQLMANLTDGSNIERSEMERRLNEERQRLSTYKSEAKRYAAKLERTARMQR